MRRVIPVALTALAVTASFAISSLWAEDKDEKPKYKIKEVMQLHKDKLHQKVIDGKASDDEKAKLLEHYESMPKNKPPKGDADNWKTLTEELVAAAKDAKDGKEGASARLMKATNCGECHKNHKK